VVIDAEVIRLWFNRFQDWHVRDFDKELNRSVGPVIVIPRAFDDMHFAWIRGDNWYTMPLGNLFFNCCDWVPGFIEVAT
jgi:hypothetical protein